MNTALPSSPDRVYSLLQCLFHLLPHLPGFRSLSLFGSLAEGRADAYSDIDLIVTTDDLPAAKEQLFRLLEEIGPVEFCWVISLRSGEWNPTIVFSSESYYHKLDIGLVAADMLDRTIPEEQTVLLVNEAPLQQMSGSKRSQAYYPAYGTVGHFLLGQYLGGLRYVKSRKRGRLTTCYRFAVAATDWCMRACYARLTGEYTLHAKLSTEEYARLDSLLTSDDSSALLDVLDFSSPATMDRAVVGVFTELQSHCEAIAGVLGEPFPVEVFSRMLGFIRCELGVTECEVVH